MKPKVILHNTVSADGSLVGFAADIELHYSIAGQFQAQAYLVGSKTALTGIEEFSPDIPPEEQFDFKKPVYDTEDTRPYWVIPDTRGILKDKLHVFRRAEYCKDIILLASDKTPAEYIKYLEEREYMYFKIGEDHVDFEKAFRLLYECYDIETILTDSGSVLNSLLLEQNLVDEISLIIAPYLVGDNSHHYINSLTNYNKPENLELLKCEVVDNGNIWLIYRILHKSK